MNEPTIPQETVDKWQGIVDLIARLAPVPAALIMRVEPPEIAVFSASVSPGNPYRAGERARLDTGLYCETVMRQRKMLLIPDAQADPLWKDNPDIKLGMISYLGFPLAWPDGNIFGTICILDNKANAYDHLTIELMTQFQGIVEDDLRQIRAAAARMGEQAVAKKELEETVRIGERSRLALLSIVEDEKQARQSLKAQEELYHTLVEGMNEGLIQVDNDDVILFVNDRLCRMSGYSREELLGKVGNELLMSPADRETVKRKNRDRQNGMTDSYEIKLIRKDKEERWIVISGAPLTDNAGKVTGSIGAFTDITEHKRAEESIRFMARALESINECVTVSDLGKRITYVNETFLRTYGYRRDEVIGRTAELVMAAESDTRLPEIDEATRQGGWRGELVNRRKDGSEFPVILSTAPVRNESGAVIGLMGVAQDITARKLAEEALRVGEEKYRELVENLVDTIYSVDTNGVITYISPAVKAVTGYDPAEITGQPFSLFVDPGQRQYFMEEIAKTSGGSHEPKEYAIKVKDGGTRWIRSSSRAVYEGGRLAAVNGIMTDITASKLMEEELQQSLKMEAIGQLAGGVAHDFNNMLTGIMGNAELLYMKLAGNPEQVLLVEQILKAGEHAANLTRQLLSFARKGQYQLTAVDVHRSIGNVAGILANTIDRRIRIKQSLRARPSTVMGDPTQIENALMNLALNARDAMPGGGELIFSTDLIEFDAQYVQAHQYRMETGQYIMISLTDTGTGMGEEVRSHIFEPFFTTKGPGKGTGLGLASVYGIAKNHKGSIECYSEPGHGTVMKMCLPLTDNREAQAPALPVAPVRPGTGSLLLVDDEQMIREMAGQMLKGMGYTVATCRDGQEAVEYYLEHHVEIDLVILDMIMPRLNGREAFLLMRQVNPGVRALLASGFSADGEAQEVLKLGIRGFVQKPFRMAELSARIQEALG